VAFGLPTQYDHDQQAVCAVRGCEEEARGLIKDLKSPPEAKPLSNGCEIFVQVQLCVAPIVDGWGAWSQPKGTLLLAGGYGKGSTHLPRMVCPPVTTVFSVQNLHNLGSCAHAHAPCQALLSTPFSSPTTSFLPLAHERASCTHLKVVTFVSRSFVLCSLFFSAFAQLSNKSLSSSSSTCSTAHGYFLGTTTGSLPRACRKRRSQLQVGCGR